MEQEEKGEFESNLHTTCFLHLGAKKKKELKLKSALESTYSG